MNNFEYIKSMNIDELAAWLDKQFEWFYDSPWEEWWSKNYCNKCESEIVKIEGRKVPVGWCELHDKCKYFQELDGIPDSKQVCKIWLEKEYD